MKVRLTRALRGFTTLGRFTLTCGLGMAIAAVSTGEQVLLRIAVLLLALPLVCAAVVSRTRHGISCERRVDPGRVQVGEPVRVTVRVSNDSAARSGLLLAEDTVPKGLGAHPRFVVERVAAHDHQEVNYRLRSQVRGRYPIGPLTLRLADPFGMWETRRPHSDVDDLIVIPVVEPLPLVTLGGEWSGSSDSQPRSIPSAGDDDVSTREYRYGDALHRVHWRSTARRGELMVRREEHPRQSQATLVLDTRAGAHRGEGLDSSLEWAISAAASISTHFIHRGFSLRVITERGPGMAGVTPTVISPDAGAEGLLLDALALVEASDVKTMGDAGRELARAGSDNLVVALLGRLSSTDAQELARRRQGNTTAIAMVLRTATWGGRARVGRNAADPVKDLVTHEHNVALLRSGGWRVISVEAGEKVADVWPMAAFGVDREPRAAGSGGAA